MANFPEAAQRLSGHSAKSEVNPDLNIPAAIPYANEGDINVSNCNLHSSLRQRGLDHIPGRPRKAPALNLWPTAQD